jgi:predicted nucleic acid-binding protein
MNALVDSVILIDHLNGVDAATRFLASTNLYLSAITRIEVLCGIGRGAREPVAALLDTFAFLPLDAAVADLSADLRALHRWKVPDAIQAATATHHQLRLATRNTKDFDPRQHRFVLVPYRL